MSFFSGAAPNGIYAHRQTCPDAQAELLGAVTRRLTQDRMAACDEPLTEAELLSALRGTARNKAPGCDGLPY